MRLTQTKQYLCHTLHRAFPLETARCWQAEQAGRLQSLTRAGSWAGHSMLRQLAVSSSILTRESKLLSHPSALFPVCSLPGFPSQPLSSGPSLHVTHFSRAFPGFGSPSKGGSFHPLQAGMNILTIPHWPQTPTLSATQDFLFFYSLAALHKPHGSARYLHIQGQETGLCSEAIAFSGRPG